ncbi:abortive infection family protein [Streptomyces sp. NPDC046371]|uniref:abortive infection family protein n=1 Tax=Streptomyces sp. NPDC046371 TaxID=3154916 RepID=UPI003408F3E3
MTVKAHTGKGCWPDSAFRPGRATTGPDELVHRRGESSGFPARLGVHVCRAGVRSAVCSGESRPATAWTIRSCARGGRGGGPVPALGACRRRRALVGHREGGAPCAISLAVGVAALRNQGFRGGHGPASAPAVPGVRRARLTINAAVTWCELLLDTCAAPAEPWRRATTWPASRSARAALGPDMLIGSPGVTLDLDGAS